MDMPQINIMVYFKKLHDDAVLPKYATKGDAGMDCFSVSEPIMKEQYVAYDLGFAMQIPKGYVGLLFPRSSISKKDLILSNCVGVIDSGYRGEVSARFKLLKNIDDHMPGYRIYEKGDAVCQLMVIEQPTIRPTWADELHDSERGEGGYGSTGNN